TLWCNAALKFFPRSLHDALPILKQNGLLVYSTCSYSKQENEHIADWLCDTFDLSSVQIPAEKEWGIEETRSDKHGCYGYRFYPRSEEHTSELQSRENLVCRLLLA